MARTTPEQRKAFGNALAAAMREAGPLVPAGMRVDEWLGRETQQTGQAIRNYAGGKREPKDLMVVLQLEAALQLPPNHLGRFLGYGTEGSNDRLDALEVQVESLTTALEQARATIAALHQQVAQRALHDELAGRPADRTADVEDPTT